MKITSEELSVLQQLKNEHKMLSLQLDSAALQYKNAMLTLFLKYRLDTELDTINLNNGEINHNIETKPVEVTPVQNNNIPKSE
jgi:hypothetical protein